MASSFVVPVRTVFVCVSLMGGPYRTYKRTAGSWACVKTNATCYKALAHSLSPFLVLHISMLLFPPLQVSELLPLSHGVQLTPLLLTRLLHATKPMHRAVPCRTRCLLFCYLQLDITLEQATMETWMIQRTVRRNIINPIPLRCCCCCCCCQGDFFYVCLLLIVKVFNRADVQHLTSSPPVLLLHILSSIRKIGFPLIVALLPAASIIQLNNWLFTDEIELKIKCEFNLSARAFQNHRHVVIVADGEMASLSSPWHRLLLLFNIYLLASFFFSVLMFSRVMDGMEWSGAADDDLQHRPSLSPSLSLSL